MAQTEHPRILVVDDEPAFANIIRKLLESKLSAVVSTSEDCASAREALAASTFDLVTMDYELPDGNGIDMMEEILSRSPHPAVVMVTGRGDEKIASRACTVGAGGYVVKDQKLATMLVSVVLSALEREHAALLQRDSEIRYRRLFESARDGILLLNADTGEIEDANPYMVEMLGYSLEAFIGRQLWEIGPFRNAGISIAAFDELKEKRYIRYENMPLQAVDGREVDVEFVSNVYASDHSEVIQCNIRDITARKRKEAVLEKSGVKDLGPGDHLCCIYDTDEEHRELITPYIISGLERNEKVLYIVDVRTAEAVKEYLRAAGVSVEPYLEEGQLAILNVDEAYMRTGTFDPDGMIEMLREETGKALAEGYSALRITGEMSWALKGLPGSELLMEYEAKLNLFFPGSMALALCQYDRRLFEPDVLLHVLTTHPIAAIGTSLYRNSYYMPPEEYLKEDRSAATFSQWVNNLEDRSRADRALAESEERFRSIVENAPFAYYRVGRDGLWKYVNPVWERMHGRSLADVAGKPFEITQPGDAVEEARMLLDRALAGESISGEFSRLNVEGETEHHAFSIKPVKQGGKIIAIDGFLIDTTDRKKAEAKLNMINAELEGFAQTVSHDLRSPMSALSVACGLITETLESVALPDPARRDLDEVTDILKNNIERVQTLTEGLLALAEAGQGPREVVSVDVREMVDDILQEKAGLLESKGFVVDVDEDLGRVVASPVHIYQLFANLISNAIRHDSSSEPRLRISRLRVSGEDDVVRYLVRDNGEGIPSEKLTDIFLPFFKGKSGDTGLGLAIVDKVVKTYNGEIRAYNDEGACFEFTLKDYEFPRSQGSPGEPETL